MVPTDKAGLRRELIQIVTAHEWESSVSDELLAALDVPDSWRPPRSGSVHVDERADLPSLLDRRYYERQAGKTFPDDRSALRHYEEVGARELLDPSPYFDTEFYFAQAPELQVSGMNPLEHYAREAPQNRSHRPNPLFGNGYYRELSGADMPAVGANPLLHYLAVGARLGRPASAEHGQILRACGLGVRSALSRGQGKDRVVFFMGGGWPPEVLIALRELVLDRGLAPTLVFAPGAPVPRELADQAGVVDLGEFNSISGLDRPSAIGFLAHSLASREPNAVFTELEDVVLPTHECGVPVYGIVPAADGTKRWSDVEWLSDLVERLIVPSSDWFHRLGECRDAYPTNVALGRNSAPGKSHSATEPSTASFAESILALACRDGVLTVDNGHARGSAPTRRVVVLCSDWGLSGVNSAMAAVGRELRSRGWDLELLFTRDQAFVEQSAGSRESLPDLPYRYLEKGGQGLEVMWQRLIGDLAETAPCIALVAYDFFGNSVVPALSNDIGVVMWAQADDGDYYEQAYRLGRYCNAIVCVSSRIRDQLGVIHAGIGERAHVIHNTSVKEADVFPRKAQRSGTLRIVYTGLARSVPEAGARFRRTRRRTEVTRSGLHNRPHRLGAARTRRGRDAAPAARGPACRGWDSSYARAPVAAGCSSTSSAPATFSSCSRTSRVYRCPSSRRWRQAASPWWQRWRAASRRCSSRTRTA